MNQGKYHVKKDPNHGGDLISTHETVDEALSALSWHLNRHSPLCSCKGYIILNSKTGVILNTSN